MDNFFRKAAQKDAFRGLAFFQASVESFWIASRSAPLAVDRKRGGALITEEENMRNEQSGLITSLASHCGRLLFLRGDWKSMPDSAGFVWLAMGATLLGGLTEQLVRGRSLDVAVLSAVVWLGFILAVSRHGGIFNRRFAGALALLSIGIEGLLVLTIWIPAAEWPVAIWAGIAVMHLLFQANDASAAAGR